MSNNIMRRRAYPGTCRTVVTVLAAIALAAVIATSAWAGPPPPVHKERELLPRVLSKPVVVYNRPYSGAIFADYVPDAVEVRSSFSLAMARNEYEPMQVGLYV